MKLLDIIHNIALLVALAALYQVVISRLLFRSVGGQIVFGLLFGTVAILGMLAPVSLTPGIIFDGRSIILAVAGLIGGPLVALVSVLVSSAFRLWLGGGGTAVGVSVIIMSAGIGTAFHYYRMRVDGHLSALHLFGFGLLVHVIMLALFLLLPHGHGLRIIEELGPVILVIYPLATMLISMLFQDYEEQESTRAHLHQLAYYDSLTGLPNRALLIRRLERLLADRPEEPGDGVLMFFNLDRFKTLNDARGHATGDSLLREVTARTKPLLHSSDTLARVGADEFALLLHRPGEHATTFRLTINELAGRLHETLREPLHIGSDEISITFSLGIVIFTAGSGESASDTMRCADTALHQAKQRGGNQTVFFEQTMSKTVEHRFRIERELRRAIQNGELRLFLQSQVDAAGEIVGAESLIRWQHPERGLITPAAFIPIAEETDLIIDVDTWVFTEACTLLTRVELADRPLRLSVNISPRHFRQPSFVAWVKETLRATGANPRQLTLEITEGLLIDNLNDIIAKMNDLTALGIRFSVDDFGTGYSSLTYLKRLPIHEIKIDKSFVQDAPSDPNDATLVDTILAVAERMELDVVAEGVETSEQAAFLNARGRILHQGYLYSRPEPAESWLERLR
ncbi:MAG: EAL domain-containing protein [Pseudomonadota bacterium]